MNGVGCITFRSQALRLLSDKIIMLISESSNGNRKPIRYKSGNATIACRYNGNRKPGISGSKVHAQLYSTFLLSFKVTHLLSVGLGIELQLLPISEVRKLHMLTVAVSD